MEFYEALKARRTIRDLQDREIPTEVIQRIIEAGLCAPTNDHMRNWEFVIITDPEQKAIILDKIPKKISNSQVEDFLNSAMLNDPCQRKMYQDGVPKQYSMLYHSGCLILPLFRQDTPLLEPQSISSLNSFASIWCCIENIFLAAAAEGLGASFRIPFDHEISYLRETLGHPDNYMIPCYIALGYPAKDAVHHEQATYQIEDRIHLNRW